MNTGTDDAARKDSDHGLRRETIDSEALAACLIDAARDRLGLVRLTACPESGR